MAQYKVPQDVEAEDKLLGPFTFRQFIYLMIVAGLIAVTVSIFNISPVLAAIPAPFIIFFAVLALPLKKDQPMETYLSALISFILKPHKRYWTPGERESTIEIVAPKVEEEPNRTRDLSGAEANHRLSFLADIVDTEGFSIEDNSNLSEDFLAENYDTEDMFESNTNSNINRLINDKNITDRRTLINNFQQSLSNSQQPETHSENPLNSNTVIRPLSANEREAITRRAEIEAARKKAREIRKKERAELASLSQDSNKTIAELASAANKITEGDNK